MSEQILEEWELIEQLVDSFAARHRAVDPPSIDEFVARHPLLADKLRDLLPAVLLLERHAASPVDGTRFAEPNAFTPPPHEIGDFTILREVGRGGMGIVYEAMQKSLGRHVALKVLSPPAFLNPKHLERFRFEARAAARLQHRHIVPIFGVGEVDGLHYYAMQYVNGQSLHQVLCAGRDQRSSVAARDESEGIRKARQAGMTPQSISVAFDAAKRDSPEYFRKVAGIGLEVTEALSYAHSEGVLHRDIKPSNLLLDTKGSIWVADFGLARIEGNEGLTETGDFVGTLRYMAPERLEGVLDRRSDIYSLGATLYELLTLEPFFESNSNAQLVERILNDSPLPPSRWQRSIPRDLETIVLKAIAKEPGTRYRTADEMAEDLRRFLADKPILARRPSTIEQMLRWCRRNRLVASLAGAVVGLLVAAIIILTWSNYRVRSEGVAKDNAMVSARDAVHQLLTRVASEKLNDIPMSHPLRVDLLNDAVRAYEGLLALGGENVPIRLQLTEVLHTIAGLERELDHNAEAADALKRSAAMYASLVDIDPNPPSVRESLAVVQMDLAYTWQFDTKSPDYKSFPVEEQYRQALTIFEEVEREWPERRQPVTLCLRSLAEFAHRRRDSATAEKLWLDSIARGDAYLQLNPTKLQVRNDVCWACIEYYEFALSKESNRSQEAEAMLKKGILHAETMRKQYPTSLQTVDDLAALHMRQAIVYCRTGRIDEAVPVFRTAIGEIQSLCESVPWNTDYWNSAQWFHRDAIREVQQANRDQELNELIKNTISWLHKMTQQISNHPLAEQKVNEQPLHTKEYCARWIETKMLTS